MDAEYANYYTREVMLILIREFQSPDEEMKKIVLKVKIIINDFLVLFLKSNIFRWSNNVVELMVWSHNIYEKIFYLISLDISGIIEWLWIEETIDK